MDRFSHFSELEQCFEEGVHFCRTTIDRDGTILILAPHGGGIEPGASELTKAIAGNDYSIYLFEGLLSSRNNVLHITSHHFDEPKCVKMVERFEKALAIHGCRGAKPVIYIGGKDKALVEQLFSTLSKKNYPVRLPETGRYAGLQSANICNRTISGNGVQLEFSTAIRKFMFLNYKSRKGRFVTSPYFDKLVSDIREVIQ